VQRLPSVVSLLTRTMALEKDPRWAQQAARDLEQWNWREDPEHHLLKSVAARGSTGVELTMAEYARRKHPVERSWFVLAIAQSGNRDAVPALRSLVGEEGPGTAEIRSVAVAGLMNLLGADATGDLAQALSDPYRSNRWMAVVGLAKVGRDDAWDAAYKELKRVLSHPSVRAHCPPEAVSYVCYLARFIDDLDRRQSLVSIVRRHWTRLPSEDQQVMIRIWPDIDPDGPTPEEVAPPHAADLAMAVEVRSYSQGPLRGLG
jgi:hypothetical protein